LGCVAMAIIKGEKGRENYILRRGSSMRSMGHGTGISQRGKESEKALASMGKRGGACASERSSKGKGEQRKT